MELKEGKDFYWQDGLMVLTSNYLAKRGYCCENNCQNCPYKKPLGSYAKEKTIESDKDKGG